MPWVICFLVGATMGAAATIALLLARLSKLNHREREVNRLTTAARQEQANSRAREVALERRESELQIRHQESERQLRRDFEAKSSALQQREIELKSKWAEFERQIVSYADLQRENITLKRDLQNIDVDLHKLRLDGELRNKTQRELDERASDLARRYLRDAVKAIGSSLNPNNFAACKERLLDAIRRVREIGFQITLEEEERYVTELKSDYERVVRAALEREEQARIKAKIREDERLRREVERELAQTAREEEAIKVALDQALALARDQHSAEVEFLRAKLAEAQERAQRAISMAQQTKAGNVYVISNIGTFGKGVFKVGMTRRLEPLDRIRELGDASVPFPFDVHMMISCDDAPSLENALHRALHKSRINRVNPRKEFFRAEFETILQVVRQHHGEVEYTADPEALEYNQSLNMSEEDAEYVEEVYDEIEEELPPVTET